MRIHAYGTLVTALVVATFGCRKEPNQRVESQAGGEATVSPSRDSAAAHDEALVRVVNAIPGGGAVDVYAGEEPRFSGVGFRDVTRYELLKPNTPTFKVVRAGQPISEPLAEEQAIARDGHFYTVIALGTAPMRRPGHKMADSAGRKTESADHGVVLEVIRDDLRPGDSTRARIRLFNAAQGIGDIDLFVDANTKDPLFDNVGVKDDDGFKDVAPGTRTISVRPDDKANVLWTDKIDLKPGQSLTLVMTRPTPTSGKLIAIRLLDEPVPASTRRGQ